MILMTKLGFVVIVNEKKNCFKTVNPVFLFVLKAAFVGPTAGKSFHRNVCSSSAQEVLPLKAVTETMTESNSDVQTFIRLLF